MADFVHLHVHTEFSLLDGLSKIEKLVSQAKLYGMRHLAITDHGSLYGAIKFYKACREEGVNPIIGCEMYIAKRGMKDKDAVLDKENYHLTVLARDFEGYKNLMKLVTLSHIDGFYYRSRIDKEVLAKHSRGLLALSGCNSSEVAKALVDGDKKKALACAKTYSEIFGRGNYFLEIQRHQFGKFKTAHEAGSEIYTELSRMEDGEKKIIEGLADIAGELDLNLVATNDVHYVFEDDAGACDAIVCIQTGKVISDIKRLRMIDSPTFFLKSAKEMADLFEDIPEAVSNSYKVANEINIEIPLGVISFPDYEVATGATPNEYLKKLCFERIKKRLPDINEEIKKRLEYELDIIAKKGYSTYFLVVADFVNWSREQGIISTTRGSASGSLVSYALGITTVNPLFFKLPFERFLNLYRPTLPDIDVDFADNRRDEVIEYVRDQYGRDKVAQIGTFGTMMARQAVRDVARVLNWPYSKADRIAKMIPIGAQGFHMTLEAAKKQNAELGVLYDQDKEVGELLDLAQKVEGNVRHVSVHAAGVVIAPRELFDFVPLQKETSGEKIITQYDMYDVEEVGLVKMDFLGIRNLSILGEAVEIVQRNKKVKVDLSEIPLDDARAFEILARGETMGLFQLGGTGMTRYLKELKPTNVFDIMAMISLFRPGPMNSLPEFIKRKHNFKNIKYFDPRMADYLRESYGVIVYQDDVLLTAINLAGYTWEEADKFRKAMGKKIPAEMAKQKERFVSGCIKNGMTEAKAEELFKLIEPFAAYGFNKAHAASYAIIAYQTAYMKANYPVEFMCAVMSAESDDPDKIAAAVAECTKMNITVLPPDINYSNVGFSIKKTGTKETIRFGLSAIKNVGKAAIDAIIGERENGLFDSLNDFARRVNLRVVNRKTFESLIKAGAMDAFGRRNAMLKVLDEIKSAGVSLAKSQAEGQGSLFDEAELEKHDTSSQSISNLLLSVEEAPKEEILSWERELLGFYLTEHPLAKVADNFAKIGTVKIAEVNSHENTGRIIRLGGIITHVRKTFTKVRKEEMCFLKLQDETGSIEVIIFPKVYGLIRHLIASDQIVIIEGKIEENEETPIVIAQKVTTVEQGLAEFEQSREPIEISIPEAADRILLSKIYQILKSNLGKNPVFLVLPSGNGESKKLSVPIASRKSFELKMELETIGCRVIEKNV